MVAGPLSAPHHPIWMNRAGRCRNGAEPRDSSTLDDVSPPRTGQGSHRRRHALRKSCACVSEVIVLLERSIVMASQDAWTGWISFAGIVIIIVGAMDVLQGFVAILKDDYVVATPKGLAILDVTAWG